ncbi:hypothetical protein N7519_011713 [Penicillium mononematosum]|uniref:uncharacterized protein n=1 Tax=Penicillium mononematosum TaxID=268346 RepID=UPI002547279A|nr:uncharacterized protein N7519_011713 [Penicillium mononematosum]KAJ6181252.1 hypothetical protein N7519_011713 [Penicillium mononematosum]
MATVEFALRPGYPSEDPELSSERHDNAQTRPVGMYNIRDDTTFMEWKWKIYLTSTLYSGLQYNM